MENNIAASNLCVRDGPGYQKCPGDGSQAVSGGSALLCPGTHKQYPHNDAPTPPSPLLSIDLPK